MSDVYRLSRTWRCLVLALTAFSPAVLAGLDHDHRTPAHYGQHQQRALEQAHDLMSESPDDLDLALQLARLKLEKARQLRDVRYSKEVPELLAQWWDDHHRSTELLVVQAAYYQQDHKFKPARRLLKHALEHEPGNVQALLVLSSVEAAQGHWQASRNACAGLLAQQANWLVSACVAQSADSQQQIEQNLKLIALRPNDGSSADAWAADIEAELQYRLRSGSFHAHAAHPPQRSRPRSKRQGPR